MIALQHAWHMKLLLDSRILKYEHRDGWEMQMLLQHTTRCGPMKVTVDCKQIGQSIFSAPSDVQRMGRSPSSTSSQSVLRSSSNRQRPPAQSPASALPSTSPHRRAWHRPWPSLQAPPTSRSGASSSCTLHPYIHQCAASPANRRTRCSARLSRCCFF